MGDEPYAALLPWMVFAVVDRAQGGSPMWAALGALASAVVLLVTGSRGAKGSRNVILLGGVVWFAALASAGALHPYSGFVLHDGRALSAAGFAVIAFASLAFAPATNFYTRPHVRSSHWDDHEFRRVNVMMTAIWGTCFAGIALSHLAAASLGTPEAFTIFNWVVPIVMASIAAHRTRVCWEDFNDEDLAEADPIRDLALDWEPPAVRSPDR